MLYPGLIFIHQFGLIFVVAAVAGTGGALVSPALSAAYLDIADPEHRSQVMGIRGSSAALGGVMGPMLVAVISLWTTPQADHGNHHRSEEHTSELQSHL